jgi:hypothetical protein
MDVRERLEQYLCTKSYTLGKSSSQEEKPSSATPSFVRCLHNTLALKKTFSSGRTSTSQPEKNRPQERRIRSCDPSWVDESFSQSSSFNEVYMMKNGVLEAALTSPIFTGGGHGGLEATLRLEQQAREYLVPIVLAQAP